MDKNLPLPVHIGIIMDGNGRWAKRRGLPRTEGHKVGAEVFRKITDYCAKIGVKYVTYYAFSTENWKRSEAEVSKIMDIFRQYLEEMQEREDENLEAGYNIRFLGNRDALPEDIVSMLEIVETDSADKDKLFVNLAVNYGGRDEIVSAVKAVAERVKKGEIAIDDIDEKLFADHLYTAGMPDPDLIIRPSGELRLSNFLTWQSAYSEFFFDDVLWPDFTPDDLDRAIEAYQNRNRRFGAEE